MDQTLVAAACIGKIRFGSAGEAIHIAAMRGNTARWGRRRKRSSARPQPREVYRCQHCGGWHIGRSSL